MSRLFLSVSKKVSSLLKLGTKGIYLFFKDFKVSAKGEDTQDRRFNENSNAKHSYEFLNQRDARQVRSILTIRMNVRPYPYGCIRMDEHTHLATPILNRYPCDFSYKTIPVFKISWMKGRFSLLILLNSSEV